MVGQEIIDDLETTINAFDRNVRGFFSMYSITNKKTGLYIALVSQTSDGSSPIVTFNAFHIKYENGWFHNLLDKIQMGRISD